jgi:hypothetical protein
MKMFTLKKLSYYSFLTLIISMGFISCKKTETVDPNLSNLRVTNISPTLGTYNVYLNETLLNTAALPFAGSTSYTTRTSGNYTLKFTTAASTEGILTKALNLTASTNQSFYLINKPAALEVLALTDDLTISSTDKAYIRFINLAPDASAMDLVKTGSTNSYATGKPYKSASGFIAVDPGTFTLNLKETSSGTVKAVSENSSFAAGYHYDVIAGGLVSPANDTERPLSLRVIQIK